MTIQFARASAVFLGDRRIEVVLCKPRQLSSVIESAAVERARAVAARLGPQSEVTVLCLAASVRGPVRDRVDADDVVGSGCSD